MHLNQAQVWFVAGLGVFAFLSGIAMVAWYRWAQVQAAPNQYTLDVGADILPISTVAGWWSDLDPEPELERETIVLTPIPLRETIDPEEWWAGSTLSHKLGETGRLTDPIEDELGEWYPEEAELVSPILFTEVLADRFNIDKALLELARGELIAA